MAFYLQDNMLQEQHYSRTVWEPACERTRRELPLVGVLTCIWQFHFAVEYEHTKIDNARECYLH